MFRKSLLAGLLACALIHPPAHALDFHPLESRTLSGGEYQFDNFFIPAGVTVTLVGEPKTLHLSVTGDVRIDGELSFDTAWTVSMSIDGNVEWPRKDEFGLVMPMPALLTASRLPLGSSGTLAVPEPSTWLLLLAGACLVYVGAAREHWNHEKQNAIEHPDSSPPPPPATEEKG